MIRVLLGDLLVVLAGHGVLRLGCGRQPVRAYGPLLAAASSCLAGVAALGSVTSLVAVLGGRTTALPVVAPVLAALALLGAVPSRAVASGAAGEAEPDGGAEPAGRAEPDGGGPAGGPGAPRGWAAWAGELACTLFALGIGARTGLLAAPGAVYSNDEYATWMLRGRALSQLGQLDPRVFLGGAAHYSNLNYPLFLPSLVAWGDRWAGRPSDAAAHLAVAAVFAAGLAVVGIVVTRLSGPLSGLAAVALVAALPTVLSRQSVLLMGDVPVFGYSLALAVVLLWWLRAPSRALLVAAAVLGAGAFGMKVEGSVFTAAAFLGALVLARAGRRGLVAAGAAALLANLPWLLYCQRHGLRSWIANSQTLNGAHLRQVLPFTGRVLRGLVDRWPGGGSAAGVLLLVALLPAVLLGVRAGAGRLAVFLAVLVLLDSAVLVLQYVVSAYGPPSDPLAVALLDSQLDVTAYRVLLLPAALLMIAVPVLAGTALTTAADRPPPDPPAQPAEPPESPGEAESPAEAPGEDEVPAAVRDGG